MTIFLKKYSPRHAITRVITHGIKSATVPKIVELFKPVFKAEIISLIEPVGFVMYYPSSFLQKLSITNVIRL